MNERDWVNTLTDLLHDCGGPGLPNRAHARLILNEAEAEGYTPVQPIEIPSKTGVDIRWPGTHNQDQQGRVAPPIE